LIPHLIQCLKQAPSMLKELFVTIPAKLIRQRRIEGKWSIHEHVCHLAKIQPRQNERVRRFIDEQQPEFQPYFPAPSDRLMDMDLHNALDDFTLLRKEFVDILNSLDEKTWNKKAIHLEYFEYSPFIFVRHFMLHDNLHLYRIEELALTRKL